MFTGDQYWLNVWKGSVSDPRGRLSSWQGTNACNATRPWAGVSCSADGFDVVALNVSGFGLSGPLPPLNSLPQTKVRQTWRMEIFQCKNPSAAGLS